MFDRFVGIDWSGAKGPRQRGIQVSLARPGRDAPERVDPPDGRAWGRDRLQQPVKDRVASPGPSIWRIHPFRRSASRARQRQLDAALARALCP